ncbi:MAG: hypothetical protein EOO46_03200 [Flavobacterium sp.]|nr:MAG: hypothetical protein EOO46_03200 [Flavobacterium sp.]
MDNNVSEWQPEKTVMQKIIAFKFFPVLLLILNIFFFFYIIPIDIAQNNDIFFAILGGAITLVLSFWSVFRVFSESTWDSFYLLLSGICIGSLFIFGIAFIARTTDFSSETLKEDGLIAEAVVIDRTKIYGRRGKSIQSITVEFKTNKGELAHAKIDVSESQYEFFSEGRRVPIKYSSEYTNIATLYLNENAAQKPQSVDSIKFEHYKLIYGEEKARQILEAQKK